MIVIGVDPGITGAFAVLRDAGSGLYGFSVTSMPTRPMVGGKKTRLTKNIKREIDWAVLRDEILGKAGLDHHYPFDRAIVDGIFIEKGQPMPGQGSVSGFKYGGTCEGIRAIFETTLDTPPTFLHPRLWKKALNVPADKDAARERASELMPWAAQNWPLKKDHNKAEAALIAWYGRQTLRARAT